MTQVWHHRHGLASADIVIDNQTGGPVKDVAVSCDFFGKSGTKIGTRTATVYDVFPAGRATMRAVW